MMKSSFRKLWRNKLALAVTASVLAIGYVPQTFAATYTNQTIWGTDRDKTTFGSAVTKDAAGNYVYDFGEAATFNLSGKEAVITSELPSGIIINSDLTVTSHGSKYSSIAIKAGWPEGTFNMDGNQRGKITINGDLTIRDASVEGGWGVTAENIHGNYQDYKGARWQPVGVKAGLNGDIVLNGDIDLAVRGSALVTDPYYTALNIDDYALSTITTTGNVNIETPEDYTESFYSIANYGGTINVNTDGTNVGDKKVVIKGNIITMADDGNGGDYYYRNGRTNIALTTSDSSWTGVVDNSGKSQAGEVNLWVQNNASWNHKALSMTDGLSHKTMPTPSVDHYGDYDGISHINKFVGGNSAANQGYIFQNDTADINIKNYSGYTTVFYEHESAGTEAENYKAGDIVIGTAAKDSSISLVTANNGIDTENSTVVNSVLNTLAGKLTYSDYSNNPDNLAADVKIAGGLTADSVTLKSGAIQFTEDGKGTYSKVISNFATSLTGNAASDTEYSDAGVIQADGSYKFTADTSINVSGEGVKAINLAKAAKIDAAGKDLTLNVTEATKQNAGITQNVEGTTTVTADKLKINVESTDSNGAHGIYHTKGNLTINGNTEMKIDGISNTMGIYSKADTVFNGDVKIEIDGHNGGYAEYGASGIYATANTGGGTGGTITVNGNVDISGNANGLFANMGGATINVKGGNIDIKEAAGASSGYSALYAADGVVNMNVVKDETGKITGADNNKVTISGNLVSSVGAVNSVDPYTESTINLGLTTEDSKLTGVAYNEFPEGGKESGGKTFTGDINLWLQNGATWNNEVVGKVPSVYGGEDFNGSRIEKFTGGASADKAGNIFQKDSNAITINNYSGHTNIFYAHENDGSSASDYAAYGDTIIKHAEAGSSVNLVTSSKGITMNAEGISNTLNALAGKLTYSNYVTSERNLDGNVKIAGGLTSDSITMATADIVFDSASGKGSGATGITIPNAPDKQETNSFNSTMTGDREKDLEYVLGGVVPVDGNYKFTENTSINVSGEGVKAINLAKAAKIDAAGKDLTLNVTEATKQNAGITQNVEGTTTVTADKLKINVESTDSNGAHGIYHTKGSLTINGNTEMKIDGTRNTMGVYGNADTVFNGDVKIEIDGHNGGYAEYGAHGIYATANTGGGTGGTITVNGNVDISGNANGLYANMGGATINVKGGNIDIKEAAGASSGYSALYATDGVVNMNVVKDEAGKVTGADNNKVTISGNLVSSVGAVNSVDPYTESTINLGLTTEDSKLTGVAYNEFPEGGKESGGKTFTGDINLWLQNGATWNNEVVGKVPSVWGGEDFNGSRIEKFTGGASADKAGNIFQKDSNAITINNYSGHTNIFYAHENDGSSASDYAAYGDTIIKHAEAGSSVNLVTNSLNVNDTSKVGDILSALAGKLTYSNYVTGERNLTGTAKIAGGLTSDSVTWALTDIVFDDSTGKGGASETITVPDAPDHQIAKTFNTTLTGDKNKDLEYVFGGVVLDDGSYKFTEDSAINVTGEGVKAINLANAAKIDAAGKELTLNVTEATKQNAGITQEVEGTTTVTADKLKINLESTKSNGAYGIYHTKGSLTINGNTEMKIDGISNTMGVYSKADTVFNGDVKIEIDGHNGGYAEYGASGIYATANTGGGTGGTITVNGNVDISGNANGLYANMGGATINVKGGNIDIKEAAGASSGYSALYAANGVINMNVVKDETGKVTGADNNKVTIKGNAVASIGAVNPTDVYTKSTINLGLSTADSSFTGVVYNQFPEGGKESGGKTFTGDINLWLKNGATWNNEVVGKVPTPWGEEPFNGSHVTQLNGGKDYSHSGYIYQKDANGLTIDNYSGSTIIVYDHGDTKGTEVADYTAGNTTIKKAAEGSLVTLSTSSKNVDLNDRQNVENVMSALAQKLAYSSAGSDTNLTGQVQIAGGLTSDRIAQWLGDMSFDTETGIGNFTSGTSHKPYTTSESEFVKGARTAMMSNMMSWRDVAGDNYNRRAALLKGDEQGAWARTYGGQTKYSGNNTSFDGSYWAGQVGYDKTLADGWTVGVAIDYLDGSDNYQTGDGDTKLYSFGVYSSKDLGNNSYLDLTAKVGHVKNEFSASNETGRLEGDYSADGYSLSAQYGMRFGDIAGGYIEPQLQLTWARLGSADYTAHSQQLGSVDINQDAFNSFVGRIGVEAGQASKHGNYFARLSLAHEFAGDVDTHFLDEFGGSKDTSYDLGGTWSELTLGGSYNLSKTANFFADVTKSLTGDYKHDWKVNAGLRFTF